VIHLEDRGLHPLRSPPNAMALSAKCVFCLAMRSLERSSERILTRARVLLSGINVPDTQR